MNWQTEAHLSWRWLQWMREVMDEPVDPIGSLPQLINGATSWNAAIAADRHSTGDPDRISSNEYFVYAASMMSRAARASLDAALNHAITWGVDDPINWSTLPPQAKTEWGTAHHVVTNVLQAWIVLWRDLAEMQNAVSASSADELLAHWKALADQAAHIVTGAETAAWAQRR